MIAPGGAVSTSATTTCSSASSSAASTIAVDTVPRVVTQRAGAAVAERVAQLVAGVAGVERYGDQPGPQRAEVGDREVRGVAQLQPDPVAGREPEGEQAGGDAVDRGVDRAPGQRRLAEQQRRLVAGARCGGGAHQVGEVAARSPVGRAGGVGARCHGRAGLRFGAADVDDRLPSVRTAASTRCGGRRGVTRGRRAASGSGRRRRRPAAGGGLGRRGRRLRRRRAARLGGRRRLGRRGGGRPAPVGAAGARRRPGRAPARARLGRRRRPAGWRGGRRGRSGPLGLRPSRRISKLRSKMLGGQRPAVDLLDAVDVLHAAAGAALDAGAALVLVAHPGREAHAVRVLRAADEPRVDAVVGRAGLAVDREVLAGARGRAAGGGHARHRLDDLLRRPPAAAPACPVGVRSSVSRSLPSASRMPVM